MKICFKYFLLLALFSCPALFAETRTGNVGGSSAHVNVQFNNVVDEQYTLRASPSGGWHFTEDFSFPGGNGWFRTETYGITSEINIGTNTVFVDAASIFSATIAGKMFTSGEESGDLVPWSVTGKYSGDSANPSIYPNTMLLPFGLSYNFEYRINGLPAPGGFWRYGENGVSGGWRNNGAVFTFPPYELSNAPGVYIISAARNSAGELKADANVTVVGVGKISGGGVSSTTDKPGEAETLYLAKGGSAVTLTAEKNPTAATVWPEGFPKWKQSKDGGAFSAIGTAGQATYSFNPSEIGSYVVKAECGDGYGKSINLMNIDVSLSLEKIYGTAKPDIDNIPTAWKLDSKDFKNTITLKTTPAGHEKKIELTVDTCTPDQEAKGFLARTEDNQYIHRDFIESKNNKNPGGSDRAWLVTIKDQFSSKTVKYFILSVFSHLVTNNKQNEAIQYVVWKYNLGECVVGSYSSSSTDYGSTRLEGSFSIVSYGTPCFQRDSENILASTIIHEDLHTGQDTLFRLRGVFDHGLYVAGKNTEPPEIPPPGTEGREWALMELPAYQMEWEYRQLTGIQYNPGYYQSLRAHIVFFEFLKNYAD